MTVRIITAVLVFVALVALGTAMLFFLLLALNGFSGRTAEFSLIFFIAGGFVISALAATGGFFLSGVLAKRDWQPVLNAVLSTFLCTIVGFVIKAILMFVAVMIADSGQRGR